MIRRILTSVLYLLVGIISARCGELSLNGYTVLVDATKKYYCAIVPDKYAILVKESAITAGVPIVPFARLLEMESNFVANARNKNRNGTIDKGIPQFNSAFMSDFVWFDNEGRPFDPDDPSEAIPVAARYLRRLYRATGSWWLAFASYNCGLSKVQRGNIPLSTKERTDFIFGL